MNKLKRRIRSNHRNDEPSTDLLCSICIHLLCFAFDESIKAEQLWILFWTIFRIVTVTL